MFNPEHIYQLRADDRVVATANSLADCRRIAEFQFGRSPGLNVIDVYAYGYDPKKKYGGFSFALSIEPSPGQLRERQLAVKKAA